MATPSMTLAPADAIALCDRLIERAARLHECTAAASVAASEALAIAEELLEVYERSRDDHLLDEAWPISSPVGLVPVLSLAFAIAEHLQGNASSGAEVAYAAEEAEEMRTVLTPMLEFAKRRLELAEGGGDG